MTENNHNLIVRVVTAFILLPLVIWLIWQGGLAFALLISFAAALCALELNLLPGQAASPVLAPAAASQKEHKKVAGAVREAREVPVAPAAVCAVVAAGWILPGFSSVPRRSRLPISRSEMR